MVTDCSNGSDSLKVQLGIMGVGITLQCPEGALCLSTDNNKHLRPLKHTPTTHTIKKFSPLFCHFLLLFPHTCFLLRLLSYELEPAI